jgi:hypothetical protein
MPSLLLALVAAALVQTDDDAGESACTVSATAWYLTGRVAAFKAKCVAKCAGRCNGAGRCGIDQADTAKRYCECFDGYFCDDDRPVYRLGLCFAIGDIAGCPTESSVCSGREGCELGCPCPKCDDPSVPPIEGSTGIPVTLETGVHSLASGFGALSQICIATDWAHPCDVCFGTGFAPPTSVTGLGSPLPRVLGLSTPLHRTTGML